MSGSEKPSGFTLAHPPIVQKVEIITGFVALIDVLGFREIVSRDNDLSQVQEYVETVASLLQGEKYDQLQFVLFSDNLVINTRDEKRDSFVTLIGACSHLFFNLAHHHVAVRGAVAHGTFMRSPNTEQGVVVAGRPIVEADHYQHSQNWVGIILTPSVVRRDNEGLRKECEIIPNREAHETEAKWVERISLPLHLRQWTDIPFQADSIPSEKNFAGFAVLPIGPDVSSCGDVLRSLRITLKQIEAMKAVAPNPASQNKYSETAKFLIRAEEDWIRVPGCVGSFESQTPMPNAS
jgi:hypothetical protein